MALPRGNSKTGPGKTLRLHFPLTHHRGLRRGHTAKVEVSVKGDSLEASDILSDRPRLTLTSTLVIDVLSRCLCSNSSFTKCSIVGSRQSSLFSESNMSSTNPSKSFQNVCDAECVFQHYEKLDVADSLSYDEAIESFEVLYKQGLKSTPPSQLAKFRDVLVGDSKIRTALSKLKGGVKCTPPKLVVTGKDVRARSDLAIRRLVQSDIKNNVVPRAGVMICTEGSTGEMQATLRMSGVFTDEESSDKLMDLLRTAPGILGNTEAFTEALKCIMADKEVKRSLVMPLVEIPYEIVAVESAEGRAERLQREKDDLQKNLDAALKAQEDPKVPKRSRAEADDPGMREGQKVAE